MAIKMFSDEQINDSKKLMNDYDNQVKLTADVVAKGMIALPTQFHCKISPEDAKSLSLDDLRTKSYAELKDNVQVWISPSHMHGDAFDSGRESLFIGEAMNEVFEFAAEQGGTVSPCDENQSFKSFIEQLIEEGFDVKQESFDSGYEKVVEEFVKQCHANASRPSALPKAT